MWLKVSVFLSDQCQIYTFSIQNYKETMTTRAAIVTGAAGGIGKAISRVLLKKRYKVGGKIILVTIMIVIFRKHMYLFLTSNIFCNQSKHNI